MSRENIVLIGFMGSGKSSVGRMLASKLGRRFVDTDQIVVRKNGTDIAELFKTRGEAFFRDEERRALESLQAADRCVVATGGGIVIRPENTALLQELGFVVWLTASEGVIFDRVSRNAKRPLLQTGNLRETISQLLALRNPLYQSAAQFTLDTTHLQRSEIAGMIIEAAEHFFEAKRMDGL